MIYKTIILTVLTFSIFVGCDQTGNQSYDNLKTNIVVPYENVVGCDSGEGPCDTIFVNRHSIDDNINLLFPHGGTGTKLLLYDRNTYLKFIKNSSIDFKPLRIDNATSSDKGKMPTLSLKDLPDGQYCIQMLADAYGGFKWVDVQTKK